MRNRIAGLILLLVCVFALSACVDPFFSVASHSSSSSSAVLKRVTNLSGTSWTLAQLNVDGKSQKLTPTTPVTLQFQKDGAYYGSSGCNYYNGAYTVSGDQLHLKFGTITLMACVGPIMSQEVAYLNTMELVRTYQVNGQTLTLKDGNDRVILVYTAA